jgi:hypothetical protein
MTTTNNLPIQLPHSAPARVGQGTAVEQARATSEIYYRVLVAQQVPRIEETVRAAMRRSCTNLRLAERAFFSLPRAGDVVTGPSVHLARELARIWGNIDYGITELRQDDEAHQSEMQAYAWDLETNARSTQIFIVPHRRDTRKGPKVLEGMQDIYENNANAGARRVREAIFAVLPMWFVDEAQELCRETVKKGDGSNLETRVAAVLKSFDGIGITKDQLVVRVGKPVAQWAEEDVAALTITGRSIKNGEVRKEQVFPPVDNKVTADELAGSDRADEQREMETELAKNGAR